MTSEASLPSRTVHAALVMLVTVTGSVAPLSSQSLTVSATKDVLRVNAPGWRFLDPATLVRLKDGQSVRVELELTVLARPDGAAAAQRRQAYVLSYDLWEERYAATLPGTAASSMSHVNSSAVESWCVQQLTVPVSALGPLARNVPFWIRLAARVIDGDGSARGDDSGLTLGSLIDLLSARRKAGDAPRAIAAGPFHIRP